MSAGILAVQTARIYLIALVAMTMTGCLIESGQDAPAAQGVVARPDPPSGSNGNAPPSLTGTPRSSTRVDKAYAFEPTASDPDGDVITFQIENKPAWATFDSATGAITGTPHQGDEGTYDNVKITASDGLASDFLVFSITVTQIATGAVTLSWTAPTENTDGSVLTDLAGYRIYYGLSEGNYPKRISIDNGGLTRYVVENLTPDTYYFVATSVTASGVESNYSNVAVRTVSVN